MVRNWFWWSHGINGDRRGLYMYNASSHFLVVLNIMRRRQVWSFWSAEDANHLRMKCGARNTSFIIQRSEKLLEAPTIPDRITFLTPRGIFLPFRIFLHWTETSTEQLCSKVNCYISQPVSMPCSILFMFRKAVLYVKCLHLTNKDIVKQVATTTVQVCKCLTCWLEDGKWRYATVEGITEV